MRYYRLTVILTLLRCFMILPTITASASAAHQHTHRKAPILIVLLTALAAIIVLLLLLLAEVDVQALGEVADEADVEEGLVGRGSGYYYLGVFHIIAVSGFLFEV